MDELRGRGLEWAENEQGWGVDFSIDPSVLSVTCVCEVFFFFLFLFYFGVVFVQYIVFASVFLIILLKF